MCGCSLGIVRLDLCAIQCCRCFHGTAHSFPVLRSEPHRGIVTLSGIACFIMFSFRHCSLRLHVSVTLVRRPLICSKSDVFSFVAVVCEKANHNRQSPNKGTSLCNTIRFAKNRTLQIWFMHKLRAGCMAGCYKNTINVMTIYKSILSAVVLV